MLQENIMKRFRRVKKFRRVPAEGYTCSIAYILEKS